MAWASHTSRALWRGVVVVAAMAAGRHMSRRPGGFSRNCRQRDLDDAVLRGASLAARLCKVDGVLAPNAAYGRSATAN
jgi:hypothetical protein